MVSKSFFFLMFSITLQCRLSFSVKEPGLEDSKQNGANSSISLSEVLSTFRSLHHDAVDIHLMFMVWVASYGDHLYSLNANVSADCWKTARANSLMLQKLAVVLQAFEVMGKAVDSTTRGLKKRTELKEHPLELVCRGIEKGYAENSNLSSLFDKARKDAANFDSVSRRPPYFHKLIKNEELILKMVEKSDVPELAKMLAVLAFRGVLRGYQQGIPDRFTVLAKCCMEVARKEKFADSMQNIFEKVVSDVLPEIMVNDRVEKFKSSPEYGEGDAPPLWWVPSMMKIFYGYITKDPILKKEVDDMAAIVGKGYNKEDSDFSKI